MPSYEENTHENNKTIYEVVGQCFEDLKRGVVHTASSWNVPAEHVKGMTIKFVGEGQAVLTHHRFEVTTVEGLARLDKEEKLIKEVIKELKKKFKEATGKALTIKETNYDRSIDKVSRIQAETSWMLGASRYGHGSRPVGRYLVRDSYIYSISAKL